MNSVVAVVVVNVMLTIVVGSFFLTSFYLREDLKVARVGLTASAASHINRGSALVERTGVVLVIEVMSLFDVSAAVCNVMVTIAVVTFG